MSCDAEPPRFRWGAFGAAGLRRRGLMMEPALERRLMAFEAQEYANNGQKWGSAINLRCKKLSSRCRVWVIRVILTVCP